MINLLTKDCMKPMYKYIKSHWSFHIEGSNQGDWSLCVYVQNIINHVLLYSGALRPQGLLFFLVVENWTMTEKVTQKGVVIPLPSSTPL